MSLRPRRRRRAQCRWRCVIVRVVTGIRIGRETQIEQRSSLLLRRRCRRASVRQLLRVGSQRNGAGRSLTTRCRCRLGHYVMMSTTTPNTTLRRKHSKLTRTELAKRSGPTDGRSQTDRWPGGCCSVCCHHIPACSVAIVRAHGFFLLGVARVRQRERPESCASPCIILLLSIHSIIQCTPHTTNAFRRR